MDASRDLSDVPVLGPERSREPSVDGERAVTYRMIATFLAESQRFAFNRQEAADRFGVSVEFFDEHIAPEIRSVRRGRRLLYPAAELIHWLWRAAK